MNQEKIDSELFDLIAILFPDERRHLLSLIQKGTILECSRPEAKMPKSSEADRKTMAASACESREKFFDSLPPTYQEQMRSNPHVVQAYYHGFMDCSKVWDTDQPEEAV